MTIKLTLTATQIITVPTEDQTDKTPDEIGDIYAERIQDNPAKFVSDVRTKIEINSEIELTPEP